MTAIQLGASIDGLSTEYMLTLCVSAGHSTLSGSPFGIHPPYLLGEHDDAQNIYDNATIFTPPNGNWNTATLEENVILHPPPGYDAVSARQLSRGWAWGLVGRLIYPGVWPHKVVDDFGNNKRDQPAFDGWFPPPALPTGRNGCGLRNLKKHADAQGDLQYFAAGEVTRWEYCVLSAASPPYLISELEVREVGTHHDWPWGAWVKTEQADMIFRSADLEDTVDFIEML